MKSDKMLFIIYGEIDSVIKKIDGCANNPEHVPCRYSTYQKIRQNLIKKLNQTTKKVRRKKKKRNTCDSESALYKCRELTSNGFKSGIFPIEATKGEGLKILALKQMLQRLSIALAQVKADIFCIEQKKNY